MEVLIQGTISSLGFLEHGVYMQEPDCYESIRDLIRFLRNDSANKLLARRVCGERNIIENDLIPILKQNENDEKMFDIVLRLLVNLVQPPMVSLLGKRPEDRDQWQLYWELEENLVKSKLAFADVLFFKTLRKKMEQYFLETEWDDRTEENRLVMERIIVLIRYIFAISPGHTDDRRTMVESNSHDRVIAAFIESGIHEVLINVASQSKERDFHLSILEIIACVVKEHKPCDIVSAVNGRSEEEKKAAEDELRMTFENELNKKAQLKRQILSSRHTRFAGSYVVKGVQAVNKENNMVVHKPVKDISKLSFLDERKKKRCVAKNRRPFEAEQKTHLSSLAVRLKLKTFVESVLATAFNRLMKSTKEMAFNGRRTVGQRNADIHYFLVMRFFMEYCRLARMSSAVVDNCVGVETFHHIQVQLDQALESAATQKKEGKMFGMRAQYALSAYKEQVLFHQYLLDRGTAEEKERARAACAHILSIEEYREMGCTVIRRFNPGAMSKTFLRELVLATHYYFRMLERSVKSGELTTVKKRQKKRRIRRKHGKSTAPQEGPRVSPVDSLSDDRLDEVWADISDELSDVISGHLEPSPDQIPINALLDVTDEEHQRFAMLSIQRALRENRVADAIGLYRAARDVWLTDDIFGKPDMPAEEEFAEIREIFFVDLSDVSSALLTAETAADERFRGSEMLDDEGEGGEYSEDEEDADTQYETKEVSFDFSEYVVKYARLDVLKWYVFLLGDFSSNSVELNKALVKMLHRVSFDLKMTSRLYQLSLFRVFYRVNERLGPLSKEERKKSPLFELYTFGFHLLKRYFAHFAELGDKFAPEVLFWKGPKECYEIENGYGSYDKDREKEADAKILWPEELETELRSLYIEYREMEERPADIDVLDFIEHNLSRQRTRRQIQRKMREEGMDTLGAKANKGAIRDRTFPIIEMKRLAEEFKSREGNESEDLVNFLRTTLMESEKGEFTRQKIIKQLNYVGIPYEKKKKSTARRGPSWSAELEAELAKIKENYDEMDPEDHELIKIVDYAMCQLSEKKPRRQVEQRLRDLGADVPDRPPKQRKPKEKTKEKSFVANSDSEEEEAVSSSEDEAEPSDAENEQRTEKGQGRRPSVSRSRSPSAAGELVDSDAEEGDMAERKKPVSRRPIIDSDDEDDQPAMKSGSNRPDASPACSSQAVEKMDEHTEEPKSDDNSTDLAKKPLKAVKKRKLILDSDDEGDSLLSSQNGTAPEMSRDSPEKLQTSPIDASPVRPAKKSRIITSDDEDD